MQAGKVGRGETEMSLLGDDGRDGSAVSLSLDGHPLA
jgi:hypothetical protein